MTQCFELISGCLIKLDGQPAVVRTQRSGALRLCLCPQKSSRKAVQRWRFQPPLKEWCHRRALVEMAEDDRYEAAREEQLARGSQLGVARYPLGVVALRIPVLALEVDANRAPIAREVVQQNRGGRKSLTP